MSKLHFGTGITKSARWFCNSGWNSWHETQVTPNSNYMPPKQLKEMSAYSSP